MMTRAQTMPSDRPSSGALTMAQHSIADFRFTRPFIVGGFELNAEGAAPLDDVSWDGFSAAMSFATASAHACPFWISDLWNYASTRPDWKERLEAELTHTHKTLVNIAAVGRRVTGEARALAPSFGHADAVAKLDPEDQIIVLTRAVEEGLNVPETRKAVQRHLRPSIIEGQAELKGKYRVIYADPPWTYDNNKAMPDGSQTPAAKSYDGMTIAQLCALPIEAHSRKDAVLFMWATNSHLLENPGPREVMEAWGFTYKTNYAWNKVLGRPGHYSYVQHELLLIGTRGKATPDVPILQHDHTSVQTFRRKGEHSEKPAEFRALIESLYTTGPYLELFARRAAPGWTAFGNDARLWGNQ